MYVHFAKLSKYSKPVLFPIRRSWLFCCIYIGHYCYTLRACSSQFTIFSINLHKRKQRRKHYFKIILVTSQVGIDVDKNSQNEHNMLIKQKCNAEACSLLIATHTGSRMQGLSMQIKCSRHTVESFMLR